MWIADAGECKTATDIVQNSQLKFGKNGRNFCHLFLKAVHDSVNNTLVVCDFSLALYLFRVGDDRQTS